MPLRKPIVALVLAIAALAVCAAGWWRISHRDAWLSLPRRMPVVDASGKPVELIGAAADIRLEMIEDGDALWAMARSAQGTHLIRYDLQAKRGAARWPLPPTQRWSEAFLPRGDGRFGYVFYDRSDAMHAAIGDEQGWRRAPERVIGDNLPLVATAWVGDRFEMLFNSFDRSWLVLSLGDDGLRPPRRLDVAARDALRQYLSGDRDPRGPWGSDAVPYHDGQQWWMQFRDRRGDGGGGYAVSERGDVIALDHAPLPVYEADRSALGVLGDGTGQAVGPNGKQRPPGPDRGMPELAFPGQYTVVDGGLELRRRWWLGDWFAYEVGERLLAVNVRQGRVLIGVAPTPQRPVSRSPGTALGHDPAVIEREDGLLIVGRQGHYFELDRDWQRADAPGWREHLTRFPGERALLRPWFLAWILAGPIAALGPALAAWLLRRRSRRVPAQPPRWPPARLLLWGAGLYLASAGLALADLWPLLR